MEIDAHHGHDKCCASHQRAAMPRLWPIASLSLAAASWSFVVPEHAAALSTAATAVPLPWALVVVIAGLSLYLLARGRMELLRARARYLALVDNSPDGILVLNADCHIAQVNRALLALAGREADELLGRSVDCLVPARYARHAQMVAQYMGNPGKQYMGQGRELTLLHKAGHEIEVEISLTPMRVAGDTSVVAAVRDISAKKAAERALAAREARLARITNALPGAIYQFEQRAGGEQRFSFMSAGIRELLGCDTLATELTLGAFISHIEADDIKPLLESIERAAAMGIPWAHEFRVRSAPGTPRWLRGNSVLISTPGSEVQEWIGILTDVSETRMLADQLAHLALHDSLTGLLNRRAFEQRLLNGLNDLESGRELVAAYLDLDQFKVVNDTCGHEAGDELLRQAAAMMRNRLRQNDVLARFGGDEFVVLMEVGGLAQAESVLDRVREAVSEMRFTWDGKTFCTTFSCGVVSTCGPMDAGELLRRADAACYAAKDAGRNCIHVFREEDMHLAGKSGQMRWVPLINEALASNRFELCVQPIAPLQASGCADFHYEVLVRMRMPDGELAMPGAFLPAAERYNLAPQLDRWVVEAVFAFIRRGLAASDRCPVFNINLSGLTIGDPATTAYIINQLRRGDVPPAAICFEITETAAISRMSLACEFIAELKALGCRFALDDFGSGISSFGQLKNLDIDFLKIDGLFVRNIAHDPVNLAMVRAINEMAHALDIRTVAEFVEDEHVLAILRHLGVDYGQGYGIGRPVLLDESVLRGAPATTVRTSASSVAVID